MTKTILIAALLAMGMSASAQEKKGNADVSFSGDYRLRYTNNLNNDGEEDGETSIAKTEGRFKLGTTFRMGEKLTGHATMLFGHQFGKQTSGNAVAPEQDAPFTADTFGMSEAYAKWNLADSWNLQAGRFGYQIGDGKVLSIDDYQQKPNSMEGVVVGWDTEWAKLNILGFQHRDQDVVSPDGDDKDASTFGVSVDVKNTPEWLKTANIHVLQNSTDGSTSDVGQDVMRLGLTVGGVWTALDWDFTYAQHTGTLPGDVDSEANMMDLTAGWTFADLMKLRVYFNYHMDTGDKTGAGEGETNEAYQPYLYDTYKYAGLAGVVSWGNLTDTSVGISIEPMDNMTVALAYHMFAASEKTGTNTFGGDYSELSATEEAIGNEIDLSVMQKYDNGMNVGFRYSTFTPGDRLKDNTTPEEENYDQIWLQGSASF